MENEFTLDIEKEIKKIQSVLNEIKTPTNVIVNPNEAIRIINLAAIIFDCYVNIIDFEDRLKNKEDN